jgi:hypothetical protein
VRRAARRAACAEPTGIEGVTFAGVPYTLGGIYVQDLIATTDSASPTNAFVSACEAIPQNEVGLVRLAHSIYGVTPLHYAPPNQTYPLVNQCTIVGYGADSTQVPYTRRSAPEQVLDDGAGSGVNFYGFMFQVAQAGSLGRGDQGAPVLCNGVITAFPNCTDPAGPDNEQWLTRLDVVSDWITGQIGLWECGARNLWDAANQTCTDPCPDGWYWSDQTHSCRKLPVGPCYPIKCW